MDIDLIRCPFVLCSLDVLFCFSSPLHSTLLLVLVVSRRGAGGRFSRECSPGGKGRGQKQRRRPQPSFNSIDLERIVATPPESLSLVDKFDFDGSKSDLQLLNHSLARYPTQHPIRSLVSLYWITIRE